MSAQRLSSVPGWYCYTVAVMSQKPSQRLLLPARTGSPAAIRYAAIAIVILWLPPLLANTPAFPVIPLQELPSADSRQKSITYSYRFSSMGREFELLLEPSTLQIDTGATTLSLPALYQGEVAGDPDSWVRLTDTDGRLTGMFKAFGELYKLEDPAVLDDTGDADTDTVLLKASGLHYPKNGTYQRVFGSLATQLYPPPPADTGNRKGRFGQQTSATSRTGDNRTSTGRSVTQTRAGQQNPTRAVRIGVIVDSLYDQKMNANGVTRAIGILNAVDGIYQDELGLAIVVDTIVLLDQETDPLRDLDGDIEDHLLAVREYRIQSPELAADLGLVHLFTGIQRPAEVIGLSWIGSVCRTDGYDVSLSTRFVFDDLLAAHEIAHNLGAVHDDLTNCNTDDTQIMWPLLSTQTKSQFSGCSKRSVRPGIAAACNLDVLDLEISLESTLNIGNNRHSLQIRVSNLDDDVSARGQRLLIALPDGVSVTSSNGSCIGSESRLQCNIPTLDATESRIIKFTLHNPHPTGQPVRLDATSDGILDPDTDNNTLTINLPGGTTNDDSGFNSQNQSQASQSQSQAGGNSESGGSGSPSPALAALLGTLLCWRCNRKRPGRTG